ncbi:EFC10 protein, partial [Alcedo cyanopectus]|nr:EFC10 protein [Ceyx cyanopectus]
ATASEEESRQYLQQHRLPELLQRLAALLLYHRPENPREFLIQALEQVQAARRAEGQFPQLLDESNLGAMFSLLDVLGLGHISAAQHTEALKTLGLSTEDVELADDEKITLEVFKEEV